MVRRPATALPRFLLLYAALFAGFGVQSPFLGAFLSWRGLTPEAIGMVLAAGTAIRLVAGPVGGRIADASGKPRLVLTICTAAAAVLALGYLPATGFVLLLAISLAQAIALAPINPLADALTLAASVANRGFAYGWVRAAGSAAFIAGTVVAGYAVAQTGLPAIVWLNALFLASAVISSMRIRDALRPSDRLPVPARSPGGAAVAEVSGLRHLLLQPDFMRLMLVAGLIQGSHALHDSFAVIRWSEAGIASGTIGWLWSESVIAEVVVFLLLGRRLIDRLGPGGASILAACGGIVRWAVLAYSASVAAAALVEPLHGLTFALQHLACMRLLSDIVPRQLAGTAQAFYSTVAIGVAYALATLASGPLYGHYGAGGFWLMAGLCAAAIPVAARLPSR